MYAFLLVLGAVASAAGFALIASGVPISEFALGNTLIVAGAIAVAGGFIIVGLGLAIRQLQRIERALAARPMPRAARPGEAAAPAPAVVAVPTAVHAPAPAAVAPAPAAQPAPAIVVTETQPAAPRIPFPARPKPDNRQIAEVNGSAAPSPVAAEETAFERLRQKFPSLTRIDSAPVVEANEVSLSPKTPARVDDYTPDARGAAVPGYTNGAVAPPAAPRPEAPARPAKTAMFDALWPKDGRGRHAAAAEPQHEPESAPAAPQAAERPPEAQIVSILKSGVVDGMAYTLYSDGSIEAQLPQGTMRFGSITELRNHLERTG